MSLTAASLKNKAGVAVLVAFILLSGLFSLLRLPVQLFPDIERPQISIETEWRSASPEEVESQILAPEEEVLKGIGGLKELRGSSYPGGAYINLAFSLETDMNKARMDVIDRLNRLPPLPDDAEKPVTRIGGGRGFGGDSNLVLSYFYIQLNTDNHNTIESYTDFIEDNVVPPIEAIPGVAGVFLNDPAKIQLKIKFDPYKAAAYGITLPEIATLAASASDITGGFIQLGRRQYTLRYKGRYHPEQLSQLILKWKDGSPILLGDVADVVLEHEPRRNFSVQNGHPALAIRVDREPGANVLQTLGAVKDTVEKLRVDVLARHDLTIAQSFDPSVFIFRAITLVSSNLLVGMLLTIGTLWWFLRTRVATFLIAVSIPISLLATFTVLMFAGRSLNVISLAGLAFSVGMVVDAAIVVLENIMRHRQQGLNADAASLQGTTQVWGALFASTATTVAIFLPVMFLKDVEGQLFADLALTIAISVTISLLVATTILPSAANHFMTGAASIEDRHEELWLRMASTIVSLTSTPLRRQILIFVLLMAPLIISYLLMPKLDYLPAVKRDAVDIYINMPPGSNIDFVEKEVVATLTSRLAPYLSGEKEPALRNYYILVFGPFGATMGIRASDQSRVAELESIIRDEVVVGIPDTQLFVQRANLFGNFQSAQDIVLLVQTQDEALRKKAATEALKLVRQALPKGRVRAVPSIEQSEPELILAPHDRAISEAGWSRSALSLITQSLGNGLYLGEYFDGDKRLDIVMVSKDWNTPEELRTLPLVTPSGSLFQLGQLVEIKRSVGPGEITHFNGKASHAILVTPPARMSIEETMQVMRSKVQPELERLMGADGVIQYTGSVDNLRDATLEMLKNFAVALVILFLLLAGLLKSIKDTFLVMITIPLATIGGILALRLLNLFYFQPLDLLTMIGFVILLGLVVNNAILLVLQTREAERSGVRRAEAVLQALRIRIRPILMTTLTSIVGMLPLLLVPGEGNLIYRGLAGVIVGGMTVSALFTLLLLPCFLRLGESPSDGFSQPPTSAI